MLPVINQLVIREATCTSNVRLQTQYGHFIAVRMDMRLLKSNQRAAAKQSRQAKTSTDDVIIHVTNHVMDECTAREVFERRSTVQECLPISDAASAGPSLQLGRPRGGMKRKMADTDSEGTRSDVDRPARPAGRPVRRVKRMCDRDLSETTPQQVPEQAIRSAARSDGSLKNAFPLLASRILSPPTVKGDVRNGEENPNSRHAAVTTHFLIVPDEYFKFLPVSGAPNDDANHAGVGFPTYDASQQSPGSTVSLTSPSSDEKPSSYRDELWTSPDSTLSPECGYELADAYRTGSSCYSYSDVIDNPVCGMPEGDEKAISSILSDFGDKALDQIMGDFDFQSEMSAFDMVTAAGEEPATKREPAEMKKPSLSDQHQQPVVATAPFVKPDCAKTIEAFHDVTSSDCIQRRAVGSTNRSERLRDLLAVYQNVVTLAVAELVKNQVTSRFVHNAAAILSQTPSSSSPPPPNLPSSLTQLDRLLGTCTPESSSASSSNVLLKALALNDLTSELLTLFNGSGNGNGAVMSHPQQSDCRQAYGAMTSL